MRKAIKVILVLLVIFSALSFNSVSVKADYCEDSYGNQIPPELC